MVWVCWLKGEIVSKSALEQFLVSLGIKPTGNRKKDMKLAAKIIPKYKGKRYNPK